MGTFNSLSEIIAADDGGAPIAGARMFIYADGRDTLSPIFEDSGLTILRANPVISGPDGRFAIPHVMEGTYRIEVRRPSGALLFEQGDMRAEADAYMGVVRRFASCAALLADSVFSYADGTGRRRIAPGSLLDVVEGGFSYRVAVADAVDHHLTTAGGVKLYVMPTGPGQMHVDAFGAVGDGVTDDTLALQTAIDAALLAQKTVIFQSGKTYLAFALKVSVDLDLNGATLKKRAYTENDPDIGSFTGDPATFWISTVPMLIYLTRGAEIRNGVIDGNYAAETLNLAPSVGSFAAVCTSRKPMRGSSRRCAAASRTMSSPWAMPCVPT